MNAIEHAGPTGAFEVDAAIVGDEVDVVVRDHGRWRSARAAVGGGEGEGEDGNSGAGGHGLGMMRELMDTVEVTPRDSGTTVHLRRLVERDAAP